MAFGVQTILGLCRWLMPVRAVKGNWQQRADISRFLQDYEKTLKKLAPDNPLRQEISRYFKRQAVHRKANIKNPEALFPTDIYNPDTHQTLSILHGDPQNPSERKAISMRFKDTLPSPLNPYPLSTQTMINLGKYKAPPQVKPGLLLQNHWIRIYDLMHTHSSKSF